MGKNFQHNINLIYFDRIPHSVCEISNSRSICVASLLMLGKHLSSGCCDIYQKSHFLVLPPWFSETFRCEVLHMVAIADMNHTGWGFDTGYGTTPGVKLFFFFLSHWSVYNNNTTWSGHWKNMLQCLIRSRRREGILKRQFTLYLLTRYSSQFLPWFLPCLKWN